MAATGFPLHLIPAEAATPATLLFGARRKPLAEILLDMNAVTSTRMLKAIQLRTALKIDLPRILLAHDWVTEAQLIDALAVQWSAQTIDLSAEPPDPRLIDRFGVELCLQNGILPWQQIGDSTIVATSRPDDFATLCDRLPRRTGPWIMALATETSIQAAILGARRTALARKAERLVPDHESCRSFDLGAFRKIASGFCIALALLMMASPMLAFLPIFAWALLTLVLCTGLKIIATISEFRCVDKPTLGTAHSTRPDRNPPVISLLVPLFHEDDIAPRLVSRLGRLNYPKTLLDVLLIVEEDDLRTREALSRSGLPPWMRTVIVPPGPIRTKPRALNYALNFCKGSILGVYDAEDAPDPDQLLTVVRHFERSGPNVACLQGVLDYYNADHNWLTRCFTVEYATWFRVVLPGIARLGLVVPLGGTTLFFRKSVLQSLGGWDAHNVTEDADLGIRLARHGYTTELIPTVTHEEPNARALPWIRQRSRWLKGYAITWAVHMRDPWRLWRDLGPRRFLGVQIMFLGSVSQYLLAPVLWSFWVMMFGFWHPLTHIMSHPATIILGSLFLLSEVVNVVVGVWAVRQPSHRHLAKWVPTMHVYFPLGALASYKALWEVISKPFFWDKTKHGVIDTFDKPAPAATATSPALSLTQPLQPAEVSAPPEPPRRPGLTIWSRPAPFADVNLAPVPARARRSQIALAARRTGIELQSRLEGL